MCRLIPVTERRLKWLVVTCALFTALSGATASHAQLYKWVDENGKTQYSDTIPPASTDRARKELRADGTVKANTERAATAEEKRLAAAKAAEDAKLKIAEDERNRKDKALLLTYSSLADFDRVRDRALAALANDIRALSEREILLAKIIAGDGKLPPGAVQPAPTKGVPVKSAHIVLLEAKSELPRTKDSVVRKRSDLEGLTLLYAADRGRLTGLIDAEKAKLGAAQPPAPVPVTTAPAPKKK